MSQIPAPGPPPAGSMLLPRAAIQARVTELGAEITHHYQGQRPLVLGVMNGALFFLADLLRALDVEVEMACISLASYAGRKSTGQLLGLDALPATLVAGRAILIVDDILDTGLTLRGLAARVRELGAADVRICVLLQKRRPREVAVQADWFGFEMEDEFVVGYGLDHDGRYRSLPDIWKMPTQAANGSS